MIAFLKSLGLELRLPYLKPKTRVPYFFDYKAKVLIDIDDNMQ